jgi:heme oxygenase
MNDIYSYSGFRDALAKHHYERALAESEKVRLMKIGTDEKDLPKVTSGVNLRQIIRSLPSRIAQSTSSLLITLKLKNDTLNV